MEGAENQQSIPLVIVTGLSGAGKSTALNVFEDLGFFIVDGLPASLVPKMVSLFKGENQRSHRGLVLGMDLRRMDFMTEWEGAFNELADMGVIPNILFVEARTDVLVRRYAATRRPHPMALILSGADSGQSLGLETAIEKERVLLAPLRSMSVLVLDTSEYSVHDLRRKIQDKWFVIDSATRSMRVHLITFGFKYGTPTEADLVFDLRFLPNPYFNPQLKHFSGKDKRVSDFVLASEPGATFMVRLKEFIDFLMPLYEEEGRYRITVGLGCTGGRHRSVSVAEALFDSFKKSNYAVSLEHRHLELG